MKGFFRVLQITVKHQPKLGTVSCAIQSGAKIDNCKGFMYAEFAPRTPDIKVAETFAAEINPKKENNVEVEFNCGESKEGLVCAALWEPKDEEPRTPPKRGRGGTGRHSSRSGPQEKRGQRHSGRQGQPGSTVQESLPDQHTRQEEEEETTFDKQSQTHLGTQQGPNLTMSGEPASQAELENEKLNKQELETSQSQG
ncbi:unnamed protein product [Cylicocyclus nassatus]|uniref:Uncharacterized protein n=1 Tax=Cylicocyclus nassatus TaxID=53992 RepID=A0AA36MAQ9_CYLNA|nr:unnamed protein product [Cylicocyclus nassatus]